MNRKLIYAEAVLLSLTAAASAIGCLVTAFELPLNDVLRIAALCALACGLSLVLLPRKRGRLALLLLTAAGVFLWWRYGTLREQLLSLANRILRFYDGAYAFGVPSAVGNMWYSMEDGLALLGIAVTESICTTVLRRRGSALSAALLILPLTLCLVVTDTVPGIPALFGLLLCIALLQITDGARSGSNGQASKLAFGSVIPLMLGLALVFWLNPIENYVNHAQPAQQMILDYFQGIPEMLQNDERFMAYVNRTRDQVELSTLASQPQLNLPVAELTVGQAGTVYLRQKDYDTYTGTAWHSTEGRQENLSGTGDRLGAIVVMELNVRGGSLLPAYPDGSFLLYDGTIHNDGEKVLHVERRAAAMGATPDDAWLQLPEYTARQASEILEQIPGDLSTPAAAADAVAQYVSNLVPYDRQVEVMPSEQPDFAIWFLTGAQRGYCVHFASAAAVLLRAAGVPARYVTGYKVDAETGGTIRVTSNEAHAWVEYYDSDSWTWSILEATPGDPTKLPPEPIETTAPTEPVQTRPTEAPATVPTETIPEPTAPPAPERHFTIPGWIPLCLLAVISLGCIAELQRNLRIRFRRKRQSVGTPNRRALTRWHELTILARLLCLPIPESLTALAEKAMFSQHTLTKEDLSRLAAFTALCRRKLRADKWWKKLVYRYWFAVI